MINITEIPKNRLFVLFGGFSVLADLRLWPSPLFIAIVCFSTATRFLHHRLLDGSISPQLCLSSLRRRVPSPACQRIGYPRSPVSGFLLL